MANEKRKIDANEALRMIKNSQQDNPFLNIRGQAEIWRRAHDNAIDCVNTCPTVDAVEVVRCKDCKYGNVDDEDFPNQYLCKHNGCDWNNGEHFCSYGERKDNG